MGLDYEEIIMEIENEFHISIDEEDFGKLYDDDLGGLFDYILRKAWNICIIQKTCLSSKAFYMLRKSLSNILKIQRNSISPKNDIRELFPEDGRRETLTLLSSRTNLKLPQLECPSIVTNIISAIYCSIFFLGLLTFAWVDKLPALPYILMLVSFIIYHGKYHIMEKYMVLFPSGIKTMRDFITEIVKLNEIELNEGNPVFKQTEYKDFQHTSKKVLERVTKEELSTVWNKMCKIVSDTTGYPQEDLKRDITLHELCY